MTEHERGGHRRAPDAPERDPDDAERRIGKGVAIGLPLVTVSAAIAAGIAGSVGSALLVMAAGALLGTVALLWASLRTLTGDAPLPSATERNPPDPNGMDDEMADRKRRVLRALKDLEGEHDLGRIDDADYDAIAGRYRDEAKAILKEMDQQIAPSRGEAEKLVAEYLSHRGSEGRAESVSRREARIRVECRSCGTSNEPDAAFCKGCGRALESRENVGDANA